MKKQILFIIVLLGMFSVSFSQTPPDTLWSKTFGGVNDEECRCVIQTSDGGFALAGYTRSFGAGEEDMYLVRTNASGDTLWTRTYGGIASDGCNSIIQTTDGGFLLAGWTNGIENIGYLVKTDPLGDIIWSRSFNEMCFLSSFCMGGIFSVITTSDSCISLVGAHYDSDSLYSCYLIKTDNVGDTLWTRKYMYSDIVASFCSDHIQTSDNCYVLASIFATFDSVSGEPITQEAWIIKTDSNGDTLWTRTVGEGSFHDLSSVVENPDDSFSFAGGTNINGPNYFLHVCLDTSGNELWTNYYGYECWCRTHIRTDDGGYLLAGVKWDNSTWMDKFFAIKINLTGDTLWSILLGGDSDDICNSVIQTNDLGFVLAGYTESFGAGGRDFWMVRTDVDPAGIGDNLTNIPNIFILSQNYPNPFNHETTISFSLIKPNSVELSILDIKGQKVKTLVNENLQRGYHEIIWNGKNENAEPVSSGIYFYKIKVKDKMISKKMLLLK